MILSMTGYGKAERKNSHYNILVEIKSLNSRYFDISSKVHENIYNFENDIIALIRNKCKRGKIYLNIMLKENVELKTKYVSLNKVKLNNFMNGIHQIHKFSGIGGKDNIKLEHILNIPDIFNTNSFIFNEKDKKEIFLCIDKALNNLLRYRKTEGATIKKDIIFKLKLIQNDIKNITKLSKSNIKKEKKKIKEKLNSIIPNLNLDENRLYQEVALVLEKKDINEEISRLISHLSFLKSSVHAQEVSGKKINFILQEINREINTVGSKTDSLEIKHLTVEIKNNLEKIREQVQNIL